jgi:hypothetical protein
MVEAQLNAKVNCNNLKPPLESGEERTRMWVGRTVEYTNLRRRIGETYAKYAKELGAYHCK